MRVLKLFASVLGMAVLLAACTQQNPAVTVPEEGEGPAGIEETSAPEQVSVQMKQLNGSGQDGSATLVAEGTKTRVTLDLSSSPPGPQPAHIHPGTCDNLDPAPKYPLTNVENGKSVTEVDAPLDELVGKGLAINVHKSPEEAAVYTSCGELVG